MIWFPIAEIALFIWPLNLPMAIDLVVLPLAPIKTVITKMALAESMSHAIFDLAPVFLSIIKRQTAATRKLRIEFRNTLTAWLLALRCIWLIMAYKLVSLTLIWLFLEAEAKWLPLVGLTVAEFQLSSLLQFLVTALQRLLMALNLIKWVLFADACLLQLLCIFLILSEQFSLFLSFTAVKCKLWW